MCSCRLPIQSRSWCRIKSYSYIDLKSLTINLIIITYLIFLSLYLWIPSRIAIVTCVVNVCLFNLSKVFFFSSITPTFDLVTYSTTPLFKCLIKILLLLSLTTNVWPCEIYSVNRLVNILLKSLLILCVRYSVNV